MSFLFLNGLEPSLNKIQKELCNVGLYVGGMKPEELKEAQEVMTRSARSPGVNDFGEKEASMQ